MKFSTTRLCVLVALLSLASSALVGWRIPAHVPRVHDEYAYLFAGQTFSHFDLTNPTPPFWRFFESHHILMQPSMMAKYPAGPGLALAVGFWLGHPIYGVWLSCAGFAAAFVWMLRGFFPVRWALLGGALIVSQFGLTYYWAQTYWGGALAAAGGALVFGGACRIWRQPRTSAALLLGLGVALLMHTRPFEGLLACIVPAGLVLYRWLGRDGLTHGPTLVRFVLPCGAVIAGAAAFLAYFNFRVTGSPWRLPYLEYEHRYLGAPAFIWQTAPTTEPDFANPAMAEFYHDFVQTQTYERRLIPATLLARLDRLATDFFGFVLGPLAVVGLCWRPSRWVWFAAASLAICAVPLVLSYYFLPHYEAPAAALGGLLAVAGLRRAFLSAPRRAQKFGALLALLLGAQAWSLAADDSNQRQIAHLQILPRRPKIEHALLASGGRSLVFVRLVKPYYLHDTWVFNPPPLDANPVIWAWDRGPEENRLLLRHFPDRTAVLMTVHDGKISFTTDPSAPAAP